MPESDQSPASRGERLLQDIYGLTERANRFYDEQMVDADPAHAGVPGYLDRTALCTADEDGMPSGSPRFGEPGFVLPIDDTEVTWPELRGNGEMTSLGNLVKNPKAHLIFPDMTERIGLHLRGETSLVDHDDAIEHPDIVASVEDPALAGALGVLRLEVAYGTAGSTSRVRTTARWSGAPTTSRPRAGTTSGPRTSPNPGASRPSRAKRRDGDPRSPECRPS